MKVDPILPTNDHQKVEGVHKETNIYLTNHEDIYKKLSVHFWAYHAIGNLIPQDVFKMFSGHNFPYVASNYELENSIELCMQGFYRYSFFALRSALELGILGVFFDRNSKAHIEVKSWLNSKTPTPKFKDCITKIFKMCRFSDYDSKFGIKEELLNLYGVLSDYVHARGYQYSTIGQTKSNYNTFQEDVLKLNIGYMAQVVRLVVILMIILYPIGMQVLPIREKFGSNPIAGGFLYPGGREIVLRILSEDTKKYLQDLSNSDPGVNDFVSWINSLPDIPEEEMEDPVMTLVKLAEASVYRDFLIRSPEEDKEMEELEEKLRNMYKNQD